MPLSARESRNILWKLITRAGSCKIQDPSSMTSKYAQDLSLFQALAELIEGKPPLAQILIKALECYGRVGLHDWTYSFPCFVWLTLARNSQNTCSPSTNQQGRQVQKATESSESVIPKSTSRTQREWPILRFMCILENTWKYQRIPCSTHLHVGVSQLLGACSPVCPLEPRNQIWPKRSFVR